MVNPRRPARQRSASVPSAPMRLPWPRIQRRALEPKSHRLVVDAPHYFGGYERQTKQVCKKLSARQVAATAHEGSRQQWSLGVGLQYTQPHLLARRRQTKIVSHSHGDKRRDIECLRLGLTDSGGRQVRRDDG